MLVFHQFRNSHLTPAIESPGVISSKGGFSGISNLAYLVAEFVFFFLTNYRQNSIFLNGRLRLQKEKKGLIILNRLKGAENCFILFGEGVATFMSTGYSIKSSLK